MNRNEFLKGLAGLGIAGATYAIADIINAGEIIGHYKDVSKNLDAINQTAKTLVQYIDVNDTTFRDLLYGDGTAYQPHVNKQAFADAIALYAYRENQTASVLNFMGNQPGQQNRRIIIEENGQNENAVILSADTGVPTVVKLSPALLNAFGDPQASDSANENMLLLAYRTYEQMRTPPVAQTIQSVEDLMATFILPGGSGLASGIAAGVATAKAIEKNQNSPLSPNQKRRRAIIVGSAAGAGTAGLVRFAAPVIGATGVAQAVEMNNDQAAIRSGDITSAILYKTQMQGKFITFKRR